MSHDLSTTAGKIADFRRRREAAAPAGRGGHGGATSGARTPPRERMECWTRTA
ncbi:hypothetical protein QJS66_07455 [Kocuria rhizophila]|nr:hypothetical protein QJS66_07455 [Kocuria rhizophila]